MPQEPNSSKSSIGERMKNSKRQRETAPAPLRMPEPEPAVSRSIKAAGSNKKRKKKKNKVNTERTKKLSRRALVILLILVFTAAAFTGLYFMTIVDKISVHGCESYSEDRVITLSGLYTGKNIFLYDLGSAKKKIESDPYLKCTGIEKVFPAELSIGVEERKEFAAVFTSSGSACIIDKEGFVLEIGRSGGTEGLIPIYGLGAMGFTLGSTIDSDKSLLRPYTVMEILRAVGDRTWVLSSIDISNTSSVKLMTPEGVTVMLGDSVDIPEKIERMFSALEKVDKEKAAGTVLYINSNGTSDISFATPAPTNEPDLTPEPLPTNVPEATEEPTEEPAETSSPDITAAPEETSGQDDNN